MKILIIYKSKTGFTKRYAEWISQELQCSTISYDNFKSDLISDFDILIFGTRVHTGRIDGFNKFKKIIKETNKKIIVFAVGGTSAEAINSINKIWDSSFSKSELHEIPHFYMQGGLDYENMTAGDRFIMKSLAKMLGQKNSKDFEETGCEQAIQSSYDATSKEYIIPLINYVRRNHFSADA